MSLYNDLREKGIDHEDAVEIVMNHGETPTVEVDAQFRIIIEGDLSDIPIELEEIANVTTLIGQYIEDTVVAYLPTEYDAWIDDVTVNSVTVDGDEVPDWD
jgi:hypothetical protein